MNGRNAPAAAATLAVRNRVSRRDTSELVRELFGAELSTGSVEAIVSRAGEALALPYEIVKYRPAKGTRDDSGAAVVFSGAY